MTSDGFLQMALKQISRVGCLPSEGAWANATYCRALSNWSGTNWTPSRPTPVWPPEWVILAGWVHRMQSGRESTQSHHSQAATRGLGVSQRKRHHTGGTDSTAASPSWNNGSRKRPTGLVFDLNVVAVERRLK